MVNDKEDVQKLFECSSAVPNSSIVDNGRYIA